MNNRRIILMITIFVFSFFIFEPMVFADETVIESKSAVLIDAATGEVLFEQNKDEKLPPASITKIMTMLLTMEAVDSGKITLEDKVNISELASKMGGTQLYLEPGELRTVEELLIGVAVESANDAATALGEYIGGTQESFVKMMNDRAKELGMNNTKFKNANGLSEEGHYTTAYDIAIMSKELVKHPKIHQYLTMWMANVTVGKNNDKTRTLANTNKLLRSYDGLDGIKTGYTSEAKHCLSATSKKGNLRLISVILSAPDSKVRFEEAAKLLDYGFANYDGIQVVDKGEEVKEIDIEKGKSEKLKVITEEPLNVLIKKGADQEIDKKIVLKKSYKAPIKKGEKLGEIVVSSEGKEIGKVNLVASQPIEKTNVLFMYKKLINNLLSPSK
ncbi:D-alanyl-D-alanine carboxypeptidase [Irregularibacter muris]|uniref:serine-type D-Ala-D-Ala carboxypeptidase n=1 Tax=Irregularibacter muris TaxID=1796619 RepID=A0AAE3HEJ7_9FIRM|nr:D-alanyl-D-alanine carboxypeptidase family protein [Irregularibacter muris]MCR1898042.1 D-alanyl-D-alanine carboxypeptidase [Irregularibacter muris]